VATRRRTQARELALQFLFSADLQEDAALDPEPFLRERTNKDDVFVFARDLIRDCRTHKDALDAAIRRAAANWALERIAAVDRNILRIGACELLFRDDAPPQVVLNEAIELAKKYSTADSGKFVNGVLDRIRIDATGKDRARYTPPACSNDSAPD
jgi:transcription antitermination factor NusB